MSPWRLQLRDPKMTPRKWLKAIVLVVLPFLLFFLLIEPILRSYRLTHPRPIAVELDEQQAGGPVERVTFTSTDGIELVGWFVPSPTGNRATVVASHGSHGTGPWQYVGIAFLRDAGYNLFVFDHRAHGQSGGRFTTLGPLEVRDLRGAVAYLASRPDVDPARIGALGCSMGSAISIAAGAEDTGIRAVVAESVYADMRELWARFGYVGFRVPSGHPLASIHWSSGGLMRAATWLWTGYPVQTFKPVELIGDISPRPVLLIHGEHDNGATTVADAKRLYAAAGEPKELWLVPGAGHCNAHALLPGEYEERVRGFFDRALLE